MYSILPQMLLFAGIAVWLRITIASDLQPLLNLEAAVEQRDAADLTPMLVASDTQDVDKLNTSINGLLARIQDGLNAQREFSGNVAHELRTPLAGIRALAEYGLQSDQPEAWKAQLALIKDSSMRASHLADQLLALALADEADLSMRREPLRLDALITTSIVQASARARELHVDLGATGLEHAVTVMGNATLIEGILNNLIDNALRYGQPQNATQAQVTVGLMVSDHQIDVTVTDNGAGLTPAQCEQLLARGSQGLASHGRRQGAGFGLSIVTRYAQLLGAQFCLQNARHHPGLEAHLVFEIQPARATPEPVNTKQV
jgi:two-component system sensor histidine kinase TctE